MGAATGFGTTSLVAYNTNASMSHLLLETARSAHCVPRGMSLMSLKHPEILELSVKCFSVLYTERYERQCGCQEPH